MTINEYQKAAMRTVNPVAAATSENLLLEGVMGINGEAGECIDLVKKQIFQGHDLDRGKLIEELGDVCWYIAIAAQALDVPLDLILQRNIHKLKKRYPEGFEAEKSLHRESEE